MYIYRKKVVSLNEDEKRLIDNVLNLLAALEEEVEAHYDFESVMDKLEEIKYRDFEFEEEGD